MLKSAAAASALALLLVVPAAAQPRGAPMPMGGMQPSLSAFAQPSEGMTFLRLAGASDQFEIQSSQLALERTQNPDLRRFAQMMVTDHTRTTQDAMRAARQAGLRPGPAMLEPAQQAMMADLQNANGADFDRLYVAYQVAGHQSALAVQMNYAQNGDRAPLRRAAASTAPLVQHHLMEIQEMAMRM